LARIVVYDPKIEDKARAWIAEVDKPPVRKQQKSARAVSIRICSRQRL
jgi:hypothetical protein